MLIEHRNKKGFTLMEMLIVVAIIAILVVVAIPVFSNSLSATKRAADKANERAALAAFRILYLSEGLDGFCKGEWNEMWNQKPYGIEQLTGVQYDIKTGEFHRHSNYSGKTIEGYMQCTEPRPAIGYDYPPEKGMVLKIRAIGIMTEAGIPDVSFAWGKPGDDSNPTVGPTP